MASPSDGSGGGVVVRFLVRGAEAGAEAAGGDAMEVDPSAPGPIGTVESAYTLRVEVAPQSVRETTENMEAESERDASGPTRREEYCRTCAARRPDLTSFLAVPVIAEMISACAGVRIAAGDGLPEQVCGACVDGLTNAYHFKKRCELADAELRGLFECRAPVALPSLAALADIKQEPADVKSEDNDNGAANDGDDDNDDYADSDCEPLELKKRRRPHECKVCRKPFAKPSRLSRHMKSHGREASRLHPCDACHRVFDRASKLDRHAAIHDPELKPYECDVCRKRFKRHALLLSHTILHQTGAAAAAGDADVEVKEEGAETDADDGERFDCDQCGTAFDSCHSLSAHMRKHRVKNRILSCPICGKVFKKSSHLKRHEKTHEDNRPYKCNQCPKSFTQERPLLEHLNKHKGVKPHSCPVCGKAFAQTSTLNAHLRIHTREKPFLCATCGKRFDSSTNLNQHLKRHRGEKTFYCNLCPGRYVSKGELQSHMSTHTGARPFVCDTCGSAFTKTNSLAKHKLIHLGIKPHECDVCAMRFNSKDHLKRHYRIHTGEKPYKCEFCERAFTQSNDLVKHTRSHLGDKMYRCTYCPEGFRLKTELRKHISVHFADSKPIQVTMTTKSETELKEETFEVPLIITPLPVEVVTEIGTS